MEHCCSPMNLTLAKLLEKRSNNLDATIFFLKTRLRLDKFEIDQRYNKL